MSALGFLPETGEIDYIRPRFIILGRKVHTRAKCFAGQITSSPTSGRECILIVIQSRGEGLNSKETEFPLKRIFPVGSP